MSEGKKHSFNLKKKLNYTKWVKLKCMHTLVTIYMPNGLNFKILTINSSDKTEEEGRVCVGGRGERADEAAISVISDGFLK